MLGIFVYGKNVQKDIKYLSKTINTYMPIINIILNLMLPMIMNINGNLLFSKMK